MSVVGLDRKRPLGPWHDFAVPDKAVSVSRAWSRETVPVTLQLDQHHKSHAAVLRSPGQIWHIRISANFRISFLGLKGWAGAADSKTRTASQKDVGTSSLKHSQFKAVCPVLLDGRRRPPQLPQAAADFHAFHSFHSTAVIALSGLQAKISRLFLLFSTLAASLLAFRAIQCQKGIAVLAGILSIWLKCPA